MTDLTLLAGAAIFLAGMITGRVWPSRKRRAPKPVKPVCGCGHDRGYHEEGTGMCHQTHSHYIGRPDQEYELAGCGCQHYSGPIPMPEFYAPEIAP